MAARLESVRCYNRDIEDRRTYCLVKEGTFLVDVVRFSNAIRRLGFFKFSPRYDFPFTGITHGGTVATSVVMGDGTTHGVETYARQGPTDVWMAQQLFLSLIQQSSWEKESRKPACELVRSK